MLKVLRNKKTARKIWIGLAVVIVPAFVLWGAGSYSSSQKNTAFAGKIFGKKVTFKEYSESLNAVKTQAIMRFGDNFSQMQQYLNLESQAWDRLLLLYEAKKRHIKASDKEVINLIQTFPFFTKNGQFDKYTYNQILQYYLHTPARVFEEQIRQSIILSKLYDSVTQAIKPPTEQEAKEEYSKFNGQMSLFYIGAIPSELAKKIVVSDDILMKYYNSKKTEFNAAAKDSKQQAFPEFSAIKDKIKDAYLTDESWNMAKEKIDSAEKLITSSKEAADFNAIAKKFGIKSASTDLFSYNGNIPGIGQASDFWVVADKLQNGAPSQPIATNSGFYIIKVKSRVPADMTKFQKEKAEFIKRLFEQKKDVAFGKLFGELKRKALMN